MSSIDMQKTLLRHEMLFWLAARDVIMFTTYDSDINEWTEGWCVAVNCSDTFYYACADAEGLAPGREKEVKEVYEKFDWDGVVAWCALERNATPLKQLQTPKYFEAREFIRKNNWVKDI